MKDKKQIMTGIGKRGLPILLVLLFLASAGCSRQYRIERMVWQADQAAESVLLNQGQVSSFEFNRAVALYERIIKKVPNSDYALAAQMQIARLYSVRKSYDKARGIYDKLIAANKGRQEVCAQALFAKAQTYQKEGNWKEALKIFHSITRDYKLSSRALAVPLYIARYYVDQGDKPYADEAYNSARSYYQKLANDYPKTRLAMLAENLILRTFMEQANWAKAAAYIESRRQKYKLGVDTMLVLAKIYKDRLNEPAKARQTYEEILKKFPNDNLKTMIKKQMQDLPKEQK